MIDQEKQASESERPFEKGDCLSGHSVESLQDWLSENADPSLTIAKAYTVGDLINDLGSIVDGMWSDGIDRMGDDA